MILGVCDIGHKIGFDDACRLLERYWLLGGREFDTAHTYAHWVPNGLGASERTLGKALREIGIPRAEARIITKGGHPDGGAMYPRPARYLDPDLVRQDLRESLDRLEMDRVDAYLLHRDDPAVPIEEIAALFREVLAAGLIGQAGVSNWPLARVAELRAVLGAPIVWQNQGSLGVPNWQETTDPTVRRFRAADYEWAAANGVTCTCYSATSNGYFATGSAGAFDGPENAARLQRARELAAAKGATPAQIALAWLLAQPGDVRPILGTTDVAHMEEAMTAREVRLSAEERDALGMAYGCPPTPRTAAGRGSIRTIL